MKVSRYLSESLTNIKTVLRASNHPLSRMLYDFLPEMKSAAITDFEEITGKGIRQDSGNRGDRIGCICR
jgi:Cu+-exporting ATPase